MASLIYLIVGYLRRAHGVRGEMVMEVHTDFPERLKPKTKVFVGKDYQPMTIAIGSQSSVKDC